MNARPCCSRTLVAIAVALYAGLAHLHAETVKVDGIEFETSSIEAAISQPVGSGAFIKCAEGILPIRRIADGVFVVGWTPADMEQKPLKSLLPTEVSAWYRFAEVTPPQEPERPRLPIDKRAAACYLVANNIPNVIASFATARFQRVLISTTPVFTTVSGGASQMAMPSAYIIQSTPQ